jgi:hypothetical protein
MDAQTNPNPITALELRQLLEEKYGSSLSDESCKALVDLVRRMAEPPPRRPPETAADINLPVWCWDMAEVADAAETLHEAMPKLVTFWGALRTNDEVRAGHEAVKQLSDALATALPYVKHPLGAYERNQKKRPKELHLPAVIIANALDKALSEAGHTKPAFSRNSIPVRVIHAILIRLDLLPVIHETEKEAHKKTEAARSAISTHIDRWWKAYGRPK